MGDNSTLKDLDKELKIDHSESEFIGALVNSRDPQNQNRKTLPLPEKLKENNVLTQLAVITLSKAGMSPAMIENQTGLSHHSIQYILDNPRLQFLHNGRADIYRKALPMLFFEIATSAVTSITPEELKAINPLQRITLAAIAIDKARLLLGESTANVSVREYVPQLQDEVGELLKQRDQILSLVKTRYGLEAIPKANLIETQPIQQP